MESLVLQTFPCRPSSTTSFCSSFSSGDRPGLGEPIHLFRQRHDHSRCQQNKPANPAEYIDDTPTSNEFRFFDNEDVKPLTPEVRPVMPLLNASQLIGNTRERHSSANGALTAATSSPGSSAVSPSSVDYSDRMHENANEVPSTTANPMSQAALHRRKTGRRRTSSNKSIRKTVAPTPVMVGNSNTDPLLVLCLGVQRFGVQRALQLSLLLSVNPRAGIPGPSDQATKGAADIRTLIFRVDLFEDTL